MTAKIGAVVFILTGVCALIPPQRAWAQTSGSADGPGGIKGLHWPSADFSVGQQSRSAPDLQSWKIEVTQARQDASQAKRYLLLGAGLFVGTLLLTDEYHGLRLIGTTAGLGTAGYGGYSYLRAKDRLGRLEREGRAKGFQARLSPTGAEVRFAVAFD